MSTAQLVLTLLPQTLAVCRLDSEAPWPGWATQGELYGVVRTQEELSVVCADDLVPEGTVGVRGWRCLKVEGPLDLALTGVLASLVQPLAQAQIPVFSLSTYDTDYLLVRERDAARAAQALTGAGHVLK